MASITLDAAAAKMFGTYFTGRILSFDEFAADAYADIVATRRRLGRSFATLDAQIAAIARSRGAAVATRNIADFAECGIEVIDPWNTGARR
jgi:predicted nucleic acid-binding protein